MPTDPSIHDTILRVFQTARDLACWVDTTPEENTLRNAFNMAVIGLQVAVDYSAVLYEPPADEYVVRCRFDGVKVGDYRVLAGTPEHAWKLATRRCEWNTGCPAESLSYKIIDSPQIRSTVEALGGLMDDIRNTARRPR